MYEPPSPMEVTPGSDVEAAVTQRRQRGGGSQNERTVVDTVRSQVNEIYPFYSALLGVFTKLGEAAKNMKRQLGNSYTDLDRTNLAVKLRIAKKRNPFPGWRSTISSSW